MSAIIAFTAKDFAAVAADTRVGFKRDAVWHTIDTYEEAVAEGFGEYYPQDFVKIYSGGLNWYAVSGDGESGWPLIKLLTLDPYASFERAKGLVEKEKSRLTTPSNEGTSVSQLEETFVMCAPYRSINAGVWMIGLQSNDKRTDDCLDTPVGWGFDPPPTDDTALVARKRLQSIVNSPTPYNAAQAMARIIQIAEGRSDTVGPGMDFGVTYKSRSGQIIKRAYRGTSRDVVEFSEEQFMTRLIKTP